VRRSERISQLVNTTTTRHFECEYQLHGDVTLRVSAAGGLLHLQVAQQLPIPPFRARGAHFRIGETDADVELAQETDGQVTALVLPLEEPVRLVARRSVVSLSVAGG